MLNMDMANIVAIGQGWHCEHGGHDENGEPGGKGGQFTKQDLSQKSFQ